MNFLSKLFRLSVPLRPGEHLHLDMHAHWLPGIDDGARTPEDTLTLVSGLYDLGYRHLIATPSSPHRRPVPPGSLLRRRRSRRSVLPDDRTPQSIEPGNFVLIRAAASW